MDLYGKLVRTRVSKNECKEGYIGKIINHVEPYAVLFNIDDDNYLEKYMIDEIVVIEERHVEYDELYEFMHLNLGIIYDFTEKEVILLSDEPYIYSLSDIIYILDGMDNDEITLDDLFKMVECIYHSTGAFKIMDDDKYKLTDKIVYMIYSFFMDVDSTVFSPLEDEIRDLIDKYYSNKNKPLKDRDLSDEEMLEIINQFDYKSQDLDSEYKEAFPIFLEKLIENENPEAMLIKGSLSYGGGMGYPCDFENARIMYHKAYELGNMAACNNLGYIYYYGRGCEIDYSLAYRYFTAAAFYGYIEASYKVSDMFKNGYGVVKNEYIAYKLVDELYPAQRESILKGNYDSYYADVALRLSDCYLNGIGTSSSIDVGIKMLLEARYALRLRMEYFNNYGDESISKKIEEILDNANVVYNYDTSVSKHYVSVLYGYYIDLFQLSKMEISVKNESSLSTISFKSLDKGFREFFTFNSINYTTIDNKIKFTFEMSKWDNPVSKKFICDKIDVNEFGVLSFYRRKKLINRITFQDVYFQNPNKK